MDRKLFLTLAGAAVGAFMVYGTAQAAPAATGSLDALKTSRRRAEPGRAGPLLAPLLAHGWRLALPSLVPSLVVIATRSCC